jgi:hypothetical protein
VRLAWSKSSDRYADGCVTNGRLSYAGQVKGDDPDEKGYPGPPGWGLGVRLTNSNCTNMYVDIAWKMPQVGLEKKGDVLCGKTGPRRGYSAMQSKVPALANAGPDCDSCGGPVKVTVQSKIRAKILVHKRDVTKMAPSYNFHLLLIKQLGAGIAQSV